jgi:ATP-dependent DNA helicase RecQ
VSAPQFHLDPRERALQLLNDLFGYREFRGQQAEIVAHVAGGGDALVLMPTGGGKSLCFQIPALLRDGVGVVVSPLIALMQDQVAALREAGVRAAFLNSTLSARESYAIEAQAKAGELDLLYMAPERVLAPRGLELLDALTIALFAIDESHCVSQWGHDFRPEYIQLAVLAERYPQVPRVALTATADAATRREIIARLSLRKVRTFVDSFDRPNIRYRITDKHNPRQQLLDFITAEHSGHAGIVYCLTRASVEETAEFLTHHGIKALPYHAGMDSVTRAAHQQRFIDEDGVVMTATIAFGMGIDKPDVRFVAHLDLPKSVEGYYQETGRAGRDGQKADAWMVYGLADVVRQRQMIEQSEAEAEYKRVMSSKLDAILGLCETIECRRVRLLDYFGEAAQACGNCDNCLDPPAQWDGTEAARKLLSCIYRCQSASGFGFGAQQIIDVLLGKRTSKVEQYGHDQVSTFGIGADLSEAQWRSVLRQLVTQRLVRVDHDHFNVLQLADTSREVLRGERRLLLRLDRAASGGGRRQRRRARGDAQAGAAPVLVAGSAHDQLFQSLRTWRLTVAQERSVPAYTVFHDSTLQAIASVRPQSLAELGAISGIGAAKLERYGSALLQLTASP